MKVRGGQASRTLVTTYGGWERVSVVLAGVCTSGQMQPRRKRLNAEENNEVFLPYGVCPGWAEEESVKRGQM